MSVSAQPGPVSILEQLLTRWVDDDIDTCLSEIESALEELEDMVGLTHKDEAARELAVQDGEEKLAEGKRELETLRSLLRLRR